MRKLLLICLCLLFLLGNKPIAETPTVEKTVPISDILVYCNTTEFITEMAKKDYRLGLAARGVINDDEYLNGPFISKVAKRGAEIISVMKKSSAASAAAACCEHMHDWWFGNQ